MGLRLVARHYDRSEALVASAALDAAGIPNWVEGFNQVAIQPFHEIALQGYRLMVVDHDVADAVAVLREAMRKRSFEGERLSVDYRLGLTMLLWLVPFFFFLVPLYLPMKRHKWHDVSEERR